MRTSSGASIVATNATTENSAKIPAEDARILSLFSGLEMFSYKKGINELLIAVHTIKERELTLYNVL